MRANRRLASILAITGAGGLAAAALTACSSASSGAEPLVSPPDGAAPDASIAIDAGPADAADAADDTEVADASDGGCLGPDGLPDDLSCTGLYSDWATKTIADDAVAYTPGLVFWSDGAIKSRWIHLPAGAVIDTTDMDNWVFPVGTKIWKQFALGSQIVETRLIWKATSAGWSFLDYRWSPDGSTASRLDTGETNVNGTSYEIPSTEVCSQCHGGRVDAVLGIDLLGLGVAGAQGVTLASLASQGRFSQAPSRTTIALPEDTTKKAAAALGWLHVNCGSSCHNPGGKAAATQMYLKLLASEVAPPDGGTVPVDKLQAYLTTVNVPGQVMPNDVIYQRILPGNAAHSLLPLMALTRDEDAGFMQMPPIVSHLPDTAGEAPVSAWINALGDAGH
jgi:hypothetical protein